MKNKIGSNQINQEMKIKEGLDFVEREANHLIDDLDGITEIGGLEASGDHGVK